MAAWCNASDMVVMQGLASLGAPARLVAKTTGISLNTVKTVLRDYDLVAMEPPIMWNRWIMKDPVRALHAHAFLKAYRRTPEEASPASRLLEAYATICELVPETPLTICGAANVIECFREGTAMERRCSSCDKVHLTCDEQTVCPACQQIEAMFCRKCGTVLPERKSGPGRLKILCHTCKPSQKKAGGSTGTACGTDTAEPSKPMQQTNCPT